MRRILTALVLIALSTTVLPVLGQTDSPPSLIITIDNVSCQLAVVPSVAVGADAVEPETTEAVAEAAMTETPAPAFAFATNTPRAGAPTAVVAATVAATPEATPEAVVVTPEPHISFVGVPVLTLGDDCGAVRSLLHVPSNAVLWVSLSTPSDFPWQQFQLIPADPNPPKLDQRGRYVGCQNPELGEQTCTVLWSYLSETYQIDIPFTVRTAFVGPTSTPVPISTAIPPTQNSGVWGDCGSCTTCGGPVDHCVLAPDNQCLWDAARCEKKSTAVPPTVAPTTAP